MDFSSVAFWCYIYFVGGILGQIVDGYRQLLARFLVEIVHKAETNLLLERKAVRGARGVAAKLAITKYGLAAPRPIRVQIMVLEH